VISKKVADGKLYDKKMQIANVLDAYSFEAIPVERSSRLEPAYTNLVEKDLETVLPPSKHPDEAEVKIVYGKHSGRTGRVLSIDKKRDRVVV
jgi:hypothetical protein